MSIPKIIHYCWYGNGEKPDCFEKCYASWKKYAPDYEMIEWNESNTDMEAYAFMKQAYEAKKYAFVSDIARLKAVHDRGGVYLDTDVELHGPLDDLLNYRAFFFFDIHGDVNTGLGFGAEKGNPEVFKILDDYNKLTFSKESAETLACPTVNTVSIASIFPSFTRCDRTAYIDNCAFLSSRDYKKYAFHYAKNSWGSEAVLKAEKYKKYNRNKKRIPWIRSFLRNPNIFEFFLAHNMKRIYRIYGVLVFDVLDNGLLYYGYRFYQKITGHK